MKFIINTYLSLLYLQIFLLGVIERKLSHKDEVWTISPFMSFYSKQYCQRKYIKKKTISIIYTSKKNSLPHRIGTAPHQNDRNQRTLRHEPLWSPVRRPVTICRKGADLPTRPWSSVGTTLTRLWVACTLPPDSSPGIWSVGRICSRMFEMLPENIWAENWWIF